MSHSPRLAFAAALAAALLTFGPPLPDRSAGGATSARADEAPKIFHGAGVVTAVDTKSGMLTIDAGDIPGFMDAMEMAYRTRPAVLVSGLRKGDRIAFDVEGKTMTVVGVRKQ